MAVRLGVCYYLLGRTPRAIETLRTADGSALALFYLGRSSVCDGRVCGSDCELSGGQGCGLQHGPMCVGRWRGPALHGGWRSVPGHPRLRCPVPSSRRPSICTSVGRRSRRSAAIRRKWSRLYERAVATDRRHPGALFGLALESDRRGDDDRALELYERAVARVSDPRRIAAESRV